MDKQEVFADPGFLRLSEQQQKFVRALIANGNDKIEAAFAAYVCKDRFTATTLANRCMRKLVIQRLVNSYFGKKLEDHIPSRKELAAAAWDRAQNAAEETDAHKWFVLVSKLLYDMPNDAVASSAKQRAAEVAEQAGEELTAELEKRGLTSAKQPASESVADVSLGHAD